MNNFDPFNVRRNHHPVHSQIHSTSKTSRSTLDASFLELDDISEPLKNARPSFEDTSSTNAAGGMSSYAIPRSGTPLTSERSDQAEWQHRRVQSGHKNTTTEKISGMFAAKGELPMYKDKPYNYSASQRLPFYRQRRALLAIPAFLLLLLYLTGYLPGSSSTSPWNLESKGASWRSGAKTPAVDWAERQGKVKEAFKIQWAAYEKYAWGQDEFLPISEKGKQMAPMGMGWIIVDALDTMILMNLTSELSHAREWISKSLNYEQDQEVNTFETTIRMLGGLLSAHYLSTTFPEMAPVNMTEGSLSEDLYLEKATDLADRLLGAYESHSGVPFASVNLKTQKGVQSHQDGGASSTAEAGSLQLEMKYLAKLTGETSYWKATERVIKVIDDNGAKDGLVPIFIHADQGTFRGLNIRLGSRGDSYYEYLIKQYLQTAKQEPVYLEMWNEALSGVQKHLITYTKYSNLTILGEKPNGLDGALFPKMDHLVCFMPGTIALAVTGGLSVAEARKSSTWGVKEEAELELATQLMKTCWGMYRKTDTGLSPEITHFHIHDPPIMMADGIPTSPPTLSEVNEAGWKEDYDIHTQDRHNLQRPETVESLFYFWRITGDPIYREWGWEMFESFMRHTATPNGAGYTSVADVTKIPPGFRDNMESFWLAETLKYFYLLFGPNDVLPLDRIVFNTEAHPFPNFELGKLFSTGWKRKPRDANGALLPVEELPVRTTIQTIVVTGESTQPTP